MTAKKTPKRERKSTQRPDRRTAKREVVRAAKKVPKQSRTVSSLSPEANDEYYHVMAIGIVLPALPTPLARRHKRQRPIKSLEQHTSPPPLSSEARSSSISPIQPPYVDPTARSGSPLHPTTNPNATHSRPSHKVDKSHTRRRDNDHSPPSYPIYDKSELVDEHREVNDDRRTPMHAKAATVPYEPDRSSLPLLLQYPYLCMVPPTPPAIRPHCVDACQATPSEPDAGKATLGNSGFTSTRPLDHQSLAAMVPGGYRQNNTVAGLDAGPYQSGCAAPGTTPQHNQTWTRDNEAARAAQLQHVSDRVWPYGRSAHDQTGYTCLDRTGPVRPLVDKIDCAQGRFCPNEGGHQLVGPSSQNATEIMRYVPTFGADPSTFNGGGMPTHAVYEVDQSAFVAGGYPQGPAAITAGLEGVLPNALNSGDTGGALWYLDNENIPDLSSSPGASSSTSEESLPTFLGIETGSFAATGYDPAATTVPASAHTIPVDGGSGDVAWNGYCDAGGRPFYGMEMTMDGRAWWMQE